MTLNDVACEVTAFDLDRALSIMNHIVSEFKVMKVNAPGHIFANRGYILSELDHIDLSLKDYQTAKKLGEDVDPKLASIRCRIGKKLYESGKYFEACKEFSEAIKQDGRIEYYLKRAHTEYMIRDMERAKKDLEIAIEKDYVENNQSSMIVLL